MTDFRPANDNCTRDPRAARLGFLLALLLAVATYGALAAVVLR